MSRADQENIKIAKKLISHEKQEMAHPNACSKEMDKRDREIIELMKKVEEHERTEIRQRHLRDRGGCK